MVGDQKEMDEDIEMAKKLQEELDEELRMEEAKNPPPPPPEEAKLDENEWKCQECTVINILPDYYCTCCQKYSSEARQNSLSQWKCRFCERNTLEDKKCPACD